MNNYDPFTLLGLEKRYPLDIKLLEKAYFEAQKKTHPDQFTHGSAEEKAEALKHSAAVNQAYLLLKDPLKRAEYLLKEQGVEPLSHDPAFLGKVMEWNERRETGEDIKDELLEEERHLFTALDEAFKGGDYEGARKAIYRLSYIRKMLK